MSNEVTFQQVLEAIQRNADASARLLVAADLLKQAQDNQQQNGNSVQLVIPSPDSGERSAMRTEKHFIAMVVLNLCMGAMLVLNWITDTNQSHVINAIYMMAPGLQEQIESKKEKQP
jgi:hypothetical protein